MQVQAGAEDTFIVSSPNGRIVVTFTVDSDARTWLNERKDNGVGYRLFVRKSDTQEIQPY